MSVRLVGLSQEIQAHELAASQAKLREKEATEGLTAGLLELKQAITSSVKTM